MKKYKFIQLAIEMTRRCNLTCEHCMRGNAQNVTLSPEIIDKLLSQVSEIQDMSLTGGEPLLALDSLEYLVQAIERHKTQVQCIDFVTNGTIQDRRVIQILSDFVSKNPERKARISISNDDWHYKNESQACFEFYRPMSTPQIEVVYNVKDDEAYSKKQHHTLSFSGKTTHLVMNHLDFDDLPIVAHKPENSIRSHKVKIVDDTIYCLMYLSANGNLGLGASVSYAELDKLSMGNIMKTSLHDIITKHNATCPYLCDECYNEMLCYNVAYMKNYAKGASSIEDEKGQFVAKIRMKKLDLCWQMRKWALERYPQIGIDRIIQGTVFDDEHFLECIEKLMIKQLPYEKLSAYHNLGMLAKINPVAILTHQLKEQYKKYYTNKYPNATEKECEMLSAFNSIYKFVAGMTLDDFAEALFYDSSRMGGYFEILDSLLDSNGVKREDFDACALIPDTYTPKNEEETQNAESQVDNED